MKKIHLSSVDVVNAGGEKACEYQRRNLLNVEKPRNCNNKNNLKLTGNSISLMKDQFQVIFNFQILQKQKLLFLSIR